MAEPRFEDSYNEEHTVDTNNIMGLMFGQFLTHDTSKLLRYAVKGDIIYLIQFKAIHRLISNVSGGNNSSPRCCTLSNSGPLNPKKINPDCIPVKIPRNDKFYSKVNVQCQNYIRMARTYDNDCKISYAKVIYVA